MITKGIIQSVISPHLVKVRIPLLNKIEGVEGATPNRELPASGVCTLPSVLIDPQPGDVVIVGFEEDDFSRPMVIGFLSVSSPLSKINVGCDTLKADEEAVLPAFTSIGEITPDNINCLKNLKDNVNDTFDSFREQFSNVTKDVGDVTDTAGANLKSIEVLQREVSTLSVTTSTQGRDIQDNKESIQHLDDRVSNLIKIGTEEPTLDDLEEGQVYLWVQQS